MYRKSDNIMQKNIFTIEDEIFAQGATFGNKWNGWECPFFPLEEAIRVLQTQNSKADCIADGVSYYEISADGIHIVESNAFTNGDGLFVHDAVSFEGELYFPIGHFNWCWEIHDIKTIVDIDGDDVYITTSNGYEISGHIEKAEDGERFVPSWFADKESELWYDNNWEDIDDQVGKEIYK